MTEIVFSNQKRGFERGRHYSNPEYFDGRFRDGVTHVYVIGNWPKIVEAAEAKGLPCTQLREGAPISWRDGVAPVAPDQPLIEIPKTWGHFGATRLIELATSIAQRDVANRKQAVRIIEAELERRASEEEHSPENED